MRVVQLCESFSPFSETFIYDTVRELDRQNVECHVVTLNRVNKSERPYDEEKTHITPWPGRWNLARIWARTLATTGIKGEVSTHKKPLLRSRIRKKLKNISPDVVHAQFGPMGTLVAPVTTDLGLPLVISFLGYDISVLPRKDKVLKQYRDLFSKSSFIIGISNHICDRIAVIGAPKKKIKLWHLGTQVEKFKHSSPADRYKDGTVRLLHVGRLVEKKAPLDLVEAFTRAKEKLESDPPIHLTIAGGGPLMDITKKKIYDLGLEGDIDCLGSVPHGKVRRLMQTCHLYTQHSKTASNGDQEGQGVTFVEAQASGLPVVTTRHNGIPDVVVDGETGFLVEEGDTRAMAERIVYLARHPEIWSKLGRAGRAHVEEQFDLSKQVTKLIRMYEEVTD